MADTETSAPPDWGKDTISNFLENAQQNTLALFANVPNFFARAVEIDALYRKAAQFFGRPDDWLPGLFLLRTHSGFLGAIRLATSGQIPESYMVLRNCLESALYALHIEREPSRASTWFKRGEGEDAHIASRTEFAIGKPFDTLKSENGTLHSLAKELYNLCIDQGGHPNVDAFLANMKMTYREDGIQLDLNYLSGPTPVLQLCLKSVLRTGIVCLRIYEQIFPQKFEIVGISSDIRRIQEGL